MKSKFTYLFRYRGVISIIYYIALFALVWYLIIPHTSLYFFNDLYSPLWQRLNEQDVVLVKGETFKLRVLGLNKRVQYSSSDIKVADVDLFGNVTAYRYGTTIIKVKYNSNVLKCRVKVIGINKHSEILKVGKTCKLRIKGAWFGVHWVSCDTSIAVVNRFGKVTGVSEGNTVIYGIVKGEKVTCKIKVE